MQVPLEAPLLPASVPPAIFECWKPIPPGIKRLDQITFKIDEGTKAQLRKLVGPGHESESLVARLAMEIGLAALNGVFNGGLRDVR